MPLDLFQSEFNFGWSVSEVCGKKFIEYSIQNGNAAIAFRRRPFRHRSKPEGDGQFGAKVDYRELSASSQSTREFEAC